MRKPEDVAHVVTLSQKNGAFRVVSFGMILEANSKSHAERIVAVLRAVYLQGAEGKKQELREALGAVSEFDI